MADLEGFFGSEGSEKVDPASFEKFKERIKAARAQIKALKIGEQKQKAKEEKLIKILLSFVKSQKKQDIMVLIARLLEQNIPAAFILSIVILGNEEIKKNVEKEHLLSTGVVGKGDLDTEGEDDISLTVFDSDKSLPLKLRAEIDEWMKNILKQSLEYPHRVLKTVITGEGDIKLPVVQLTAFILRDFLKQNDQEAEYDKLKKFSEFFIKGIIKKVQQKVKDQKEIEEKKN